MKPMLAGTIKNLSDLVYPVLVTPKIDGIRCLTFKDGPKSRKLKPIPNTYVRETVAAIGAGFDGELVVPHARNFGVTSSAIMRESGKPEFIYYVFDVYDADRELGYLDRMEVMAERMDRLFSRSEINLDWFKPLIPVPIRDEAELLDYESKTLEAGYEGVMMRSLNGPYKFGRSSVRQGYLLKLKRFLDSEAVVVGYKEWMTNTNKKEYDALGNAKRSTAKAGKVPKGSLGALIVKWGGVEFEIGTGFNFEQRDSLWAQRDDLLGKIAKFKYQEVGAQNRPRFPVFLGFRDERDM